MTLKEIFKHQDKIYRKIEIKIGSDKVDIFSRNGENITASEFEEAFKSKVHN